MASSSSAFKRFQAMPLPFSDDEDAAPLSRPRSRRGLERTPPSKRSITHLPSLSTECAPYSPVTSFPRCHGRFSVDDEDSRDSALGLDADSKTSPGLSRFSSPPRPRRPLISESSDSGDEGFLDHLIESPQGCDVPSSCDGLINNFLLTSSSSVPFQGHPKVKVTPEITKNLFSSSTPPLPFAKKALSFDVTSSTFCQKRSSFSQDVEVPAIVKRRRRSAEDPSKSVGPIPKPSDRVKSALDAEEGGEDFIGDFSKPYILPTIRGKHGDLKSVSPHTVSELLDNKFSHSVERFTIVDCRYPYEYDGGHIRGALIVWERDTLQQLFINSSKLRPSLDAPHKCNIVIFHCEFSSERGPKMCRLLRQLDREANKCWYPSLYYPELYLLEGGYKAFYHTCKAHCEPQSYVPMAHKDHISHLKHFRVKSKSWAGEKSSKPNHCSFGQLAW